nr:DUF1707 domain-containing protein [Phytoactinopolyspora mesophila]
MRASDADRDRVAEDLREAAAEGRLSLTELDERIDALYAAKTYGELELVVDDLPGIILPGNTPAAPRTPLATGGSVPDRVGGQPGGRSVKVVFSGVQRRGRWVVPSRYSVKAVFGGAELDLTEAQLETHEVDIEITTVFGGAVVYIPADVHVVVDGNGIFGGFADEASARQPPPGAPVVRISGKAVFGGVSVKRKPVES